MSDTTTPIKQQKIVDRACRAGARVLMTHRWQEAAVVALARVHACVRSGRGVAERGARYF